MGFFRKLASVVSNPIRGLGRIARGDFKKGLGDIAGTARIAAPFIPGMNIPLSLAIGAIDDLTHDRGLSVGGIAKDAAWQVIGGKIADKLGGGVPGEQGTAMDAVASGGGGTPSVSIGAASPVMNRAASPSQILKGNALNPDIPAVNLKQIAMAPVESLKPLRATAQVARSAAAPQLGRSILDRIGLGDLTGADKVKLGSDLLGTAANVYGAQQMGAAQDEQLKWQREQEMYNRRRNESLDPIRAQLIAAMLKNLNLGGQMGTGSGS